MGRFEASTAARRAATWLRTARPYSAGWGYNSHTGPDADSTAICLGLLRELRLPIAAEDQTFLRQHWRTEGGMATYDGPGAWGCAHWDVTPWGYLGMNVAAQRLLRESFLRGLYENRMPDGMWRAYWWRNPYYSTFVTLEVLEELGLAEPDLICAQSSGPIEVDNAFDLGCLIGIELLRASPPELIGRQLRALLDWQKEDGRWSGHANLRVTDDSCYKPWNEPVGEYYADAAGTFSTSTVVRVLVRLLATDGRGWLPDAEAERGSQSA
jgi:hypothetical protein